MCVIIVGGFVSRCGELKVYLIWDMTYFAGIVVEPRELFIKM